LFQNIIINAIKYKQPTIHPVVKIESVILEETMQFKIIDNGMGIEQEQINEIFKPFKRIAIDIDGSGLGLNTCKKIVDYYNGTISIVSTVNKGSCFIIDFPLNILNIT
jgi:two-component system CheB/CheR fusion protein